MKGILEEEEGEIEKESNEKIKIKFKARGLTIIVLAAKNMEDVLNEMYGSQWQWHVRKRKKYLKLAFAVLPVLMIGLFLIFFEFKGEKAQILNKPNLKSGELKIYPFFNIKKKASLLDSLAPNGFLNIGVMITGPDNHYLNDSSKISKIEILSPDHEIFCRIPPHTKFQVISENYWAGYLNFQRTNPLLIWLGMDLKYNTRNLPYPGRYMFVVTDSNGITHTAEIIFQKKHKKDPIEGFPENIQFDMKTRKISWKATKGQYGYSVNLYQGEKKGVEDWSSLVYRSLYYFKHIKENYFILPNEIKLEKGESYYIVVDAYDSPDGNLGEFYYNFSHTQDKSEQIGVFKVE